MASFVEKLVARQKAVRSLVCVGLDPDTTNTGFKFNPEADAGDQLYQFCVRIVEATHASACCVKPNFCFFIRFWSKGIQALEKLIHYIQTKYPDIPIILDMKAGDIGNSVVQWALAADMVEGLGLDAVTVNPLAGSDCVKQFFGKAFPLALVRMSNPSAAELMDLMVTVDGSPDEPFYMKIARLVASWNTDGLQCGAIVGATVPEQLGNTRKVIGGAPVLIPGIGKQQGDLEGSVRNACGETVIAAPTIFNSSREVIYNVDPAAAAEELRGKINALLTAGFYN